MGKLRIVSWQSVLTAHQIHTFCALQNRLDHPIHFMLGARELEERKQQGWQAPDFTGLMIHDLPRQGWWRVGMTLLRQHRDAVHLFSGLWGDRRFLPLLFCAQRMGIRTGLVTEAYSDIDAGYFSDASMQVDRFKSSLRPLLYNVAGRVLAPRMGAVFAISQKAVRQFLRAGYRKDRIFPFGYFVPAQEGVPSASRYGAGGNSLRIIYVGSLISRKGIDVVLEAVRICNTHNLDVSLDVYGSGDSALLAGSACQVSYCGTIPFGQAQSVIREYDMLILPSRHDGWGVVVNEALLQGVPVLCSDQVGAKTLVETSGAGGVFESGDAVNLAGLLEVLVRNPQQLQVWREAAWGYRPMLTPEIAADYMYRCLQYAFENGAKPDSPWYLDHV